MDEKFDVRKYLNIADDRPLEFRVCHIAKLWYEKILHGSKENYFDTVNDLFPGLILRVAEGEENKEMKDPIYRDSDHYIDVYTYITGGIRKINQGNSSMEYQVISRLVGAGTNKKYSRTARKIQNRAAKELCGDDDSLLTGLQSYYSDLINGLTLDEMETFKAVFMDYVNTVIDDLANFSTYKSPLFPFDSVKQVHDLNDYLSTEFGLGNYAGFFLWMNLGALLRDRIQLLMITFNSNFDRITDKKEEPRTSGDNIPRCLTPIPPVNRQVGLVGREDIQRKVLSMLEEQGKMALVSGLGGIGKTAVMQWVCNDLKEEGNYVAWIDCGDSLKRDLLALATALGIDTADPGTAYDQILLAVKNRLDGTLYLFLDNLTEDLTQKELGDLNSLNAHIMATSRKFYDTFPTVGLDVLEEDLAVMMFFRYYNGDTDRRYERCARNIVSSVNRHTLLTELLARAAKTARGSLEDFNTRLGAVGVYDVFTRKIDTVFDKKMTIEECVIRLYETASLTDEQKHIMRLFSIFTPEKEIYYKVSEWAGLDMDAMDGLIDLGWIETSGPENNYKMHQIIRDSLVLQMKRQGAGLRIEDYSDFLIKVTDTNSYMPRDLEYTKVRERLVLTEDVAEYLKARIEGMPWKGEVTKEQKAFFISSEVLFHNIAFVLHTQGNYKEALEYYGKALSINERVLGLEHPVIGTIYENMAGVYLNQGDYEKSLEYYRKALAFYELTLGPKHPDIGTTYNHMATVFRKQGDYGKALEYYGRALDLYEHMPSPKHPDIGTTYNHMAPMFREQDDYGKALAIRERELGPEHSDTGEIYHNMAKVFHEQGDYGKALEYYGKALAIRKRELGPEHSDTGEIYHNMAKVFHEQGDYGKALEYYGKALQYYGKALDIFERELGPGHPSTGAILNNMATVYSDQGYFERALEYYRKALAICKRVLGPGHPDTSATYNNMATVFREQGDYGKALEYYGKALDICERILGPGHPDTSATYNNMATVFRKQGDYGKALEYYRKVLDIRKRVLGLGHPDTSAIYNNMATVFCEQGDYGKALEYYGKALDAVGRLQRTVLRSKTDAMRSERTEL